MSEEKRKKESASSKVMRVVALRNKFFYMFYRYATLVFITSLICCGVSIAFFMYFAKQPVPPQYIPVTEDYRYMDLSPLRECKKEQDVKNFMMKALNKLYRYDYVNYATQISEASLYFTQEGWKGYLTDFGASNTLNAVKENNWVVSVKTETIPVIVTTSKDENGVCVMELKADINLMYLGKTSLSNKETIYMKISRNSILNNPDGLGITKVVAQMKE